MAFVAAKCTECGAALEVDDVKEAGICRHCGTAFVTQRVITHHNTFVTEHVTKNVFGVENKSADEFCRDGDTFIQLGDWVKAAAAFEKAATLEPRNYKGWFGLVKVHTQNFSDLYAKKHEECAAKALAVASEEEKRLITSALESYRRAQLKNAQSKVGGYAAKVAEANVAYRAYRGAQIWMYTIGIILCLTLVAPLFLWAGASLKKDKFLDLCFEIIKAEHEFKKFGIPTPPAEKRWNDEKMRPQALLRHEDKD
ncbi:MAG: hypothetical protein FWD58_00285 [Firmicutes bacterium]|nr:hypothetical protein [Bacillota bacterium]